MPARIRVPAPKSRVVLSCALLALGGGVLAATVHGVAGASALAPPTTGQQEAGMAKGKALVDPPNINTTTPAHADVRLVAEPKRFDIGGKRVWGESYDGDFVGPTLHFVPGETVNLTLVNNLPTPTNLHFHGMHMSPSGDADNPYISVAPGRASRTTSAFRPTSRSAPSGTTTTTCAWATRRWRCPACESASAPAPHCQTSRPRFSTASSGNHRRGRPRSVAADSATRHGTHACAEGCSDHTSDHIVPEHGDLLHRLEWPDRPARERPVASRPHHATGPDRAVAARQRRGGHLLQPCPAGLEFTVVGQDGYPVAEVTKVTCCSRPASVGRAVTAPVTRHYWLRTLAY